MKASQLVQWCIPCLMFCAQYIAVGAEPGSSPEVFKRWDLEELFETPEYQWIDNNSPIRSLLIKGEQYNGKSTEIQRFIDHKLLDRQPLCRIVRTTMEDSVFYAHLAQGTKVASASLQYTRDAGPLVSRVWVTTGAAVSGNVVSARGPEDATIWCLAVKDVNGGMVTTDVTFANEDVNE